MLDKKTLIKIKDLAIKIDWDNSFNGRSKGNRHLFRAAKIAEFLARQLKADVNIASAGAWLHDSALPTGDDYNYKKNKEIVLKILKKFKLTEDEADEIAECVAAHEGLVTPKTLEAKIVHDADVLEKSGLLGIIRHTWKVASDSDLIINKKVVKEIIQHIRWRGKKLQTKEAKRLYKLVDIKLNFSQAEKIILKVVKLVRQGFVTEKIAILIVRDIEKNHRKILQNQLDLNYLDENKKLI